MADSACAVCGFSTNDLSDFEKHIQQHEDAFTPKLDLQNLVKNPSSLNFPAVAASLLSNYYETNTLSQLLNKVSSNNGFLNNNLFNNGTNTDLDSFLKSLPTTNQINIDPAQLQMPDLSQQTSLSPKKSPKNVGKKENKSKKVLHNCPHCNFSTVMSQHMKSHLEAHDRHQGQMYKCDVCQMEFSQKANMHRHRMRHSGHKPYECRFCKKRFFRKDQMQEHSMTHIKTGEDFDCPVANCEARFRQHSALRTHLDEQHTITANEHAACKRCAMTFANSRRLLLHYQTKHEVGANNSTGVKRDQSVLNDFSDEDTNQDLGETPAKRPNLTQISKSASPPTSHNDPLDLSTFSSNFTNSNPTNFLSSSFNWNALGLPLSVAVSQSLPFANAFSPQLLPKTKPPNCETLFQNFATTSLNNANLANAFGNANLSKFVEELKQNSQQQMWDQQCAQSMTTTTNVEDHDHSSTHSPTSDSLSSSTILFNETEDKNLSEIQSQPIDLKQAETMSNEEIDVSSEKYDCTHCGIIFTDYLLFLFHKNLHSSNETPFKCGLCQKECKNRLEFNTHIVQDQHSNSHFSLLN